VTNGPDAIPASQPTATTLNNAVVALASKSQLQAPSSAGGSRTTNVPAAPTGAGTVSGTGTGTGNSGGGTDSSGGPITTPSTPGIHLPGGGGSGSGGGSGPGQDQVNGTVNGINDALGGIDNTLNGLLGR
jgi:hypothetical protein